MGKTFVVRIENDHLQETFMAASCNNECLWIDNYYSS